MLLGFVSCGTIMIIKETDKTIKEAQSRSDYTALTVEQLKEMIISDTTHYKFVIFWNPGCAPCLQHMSPTHPYIYRKVGST